MEHGIIFNTKSDVCRSHSHPAFEKVLHIFNAHWHGIRSATSFVPGHKLAISHKAPPSGDGYRHIVGLIFKYGVNRICYQGYSDTADQVAEVINNEFGSEVKQYVITHVSTSQFEHHFEIQMLRKMIDRLKSGIFCRLGSVKPNFADSVDSFWGKTIINLPPNLAEDSDMAVFRSLGTVLIPLENTWRKNLYTNVLAAINSNTVEHIYTVNQPSFLELLLDLSKVKVIGFQSPASLLGYMAASALVLNVTLVECQPMTQIEALSVGTPCLTGPLGVSGLSSHPLSKLCEVPYLDNPSLISDYISPLMGMWKQDPLEIGQMISDFNQLRLEIGIKSYCEFLEL